MLSRPSSSNFPTDPANFTCTYSGLYRTGHVWKSRHSPPQSDGQNCLVNDKPRSKDTDQNAQVVMLPEIFPSRLVHFTKSRIILSFVHM
jgi:hypothetical protein